MLTSEVAMRYAQALFSIASDNNQIKSTLEQIRLINDFVFKDTEVNSFLHSPVVKLSEKETLLDDALKGVGLFEEVVSFVLLLVRKNRLFLFKEILHSFQFLTDEANQVTRGSVYSAFALSQEDRKSIESKVSSYTKKNVILTYKEDPSLLGGLVAKVGSFTFDDTLTTHLKRLREELKRRVN